MLTGLLAICAGLAFALLLCLYLFLTLKAEMRARERRARQELEAVVVLAGQQVEQLEARLAALEQTASGAQPRPGMNLTIRTQVLRRRRQGEDAAQIATALGLPRTEVELLLKVDRLTLDRV